MRILFDTNIVLDVLEARAPYHRDAVTLFSAVDRGWLTGLLCATTITTIHYIARQALGAAKTREQLRKILGMFTIAPVTHGIIVDALELAFPDFEDAVLHEAAASADAVGIVTRNPKDFHQSRLRIYSPASLVASLRTLHP